MEKSIPEFMESIPQFFVPEKATGIDAVVQFHLTGDNGGDWFVTIRDRHCSVDKGEASSPKLVFTAAAQDCLDILTGKLDGMRAFMTGKLKLKGDMSLAMKLTSLFKLDQ